MTSALRPEAPLVNYRPAPPPAAADFVVVANRLPVALERTAEGTDQWSRSPRGLVSALEAHVRARRGAWVGWPGATSATMPGFMHGDLLLPPVHLSITDVRDYYHGFANGTLWRFSQRRRGAHQRIPGQPAKPGRREVCPDRGHQGRSR
jgi:trehalose-6-phosphate synthase